MIARAVAGVVGFGVGVVCAGFFAFVVTATCVGVGQAIVGHPFPVVGFGLLVGLYAAART